MSKPVKVDKEKDKELERLKKDNLEKDRLLKEKEQELKLQETNKQELQEKLKQDAEDRLEEKKTKRKSKSPSKGTKVIVEDATSSPLKARPATSPTKVIDITEGVEASPSPMKQTVVKRGFDAEEVARLIKTTVESMNKGVPIDTQTLGMAGETLPQEFIKDLEQIQKHKIKFIGSQGGSSLMRATALTKRDKLQLVKLGLSKGLLEEDMKGKDIS
jgi:hypothetical protein